MRFWMLSFALLSPLAVSCGDDSSPTRFETFEEACAALEGCGDRTPTVTETIWRIEVVKGADGTYRFGAIDSVDVPEGDGVPFGPLEGEVALAGLDASGTPVDGQMVKFPSTVSFENNFEGHGRIEEDLLSDAMVLGYVRAAPEVQSFALLDEDDAVLLEAPIPAAIVSEEVGSRTDGLFRASASCPHVLLLSQGTLLEFGTSRGRFDIPIVEPGPMQQAIVDAAFARATPMVCNGVGRIAFGEVPNRPDLGGQVWTYGAGDLIVVNTTRMEGLAEVYTEEWLAENPEWRVRLMKTILHEAGHATEALLNVVSRRTEMARGAWVRNSRGLAARTVENTRMQKGLTREWLRLHESFVDLGWAEAYPPDLDSVRDTVGVYGFEETARAGAMSRYGATGQADDIADMVAWSAMGEIFERQGIPAGRNDREDFACQAMATHESQSVPSRYAAVFSKLRFLQDLGLVWPEDVTRCIGRVGLDDALEGMRFFTAESEGTTYTENVSAVIGTLGEQRVFEMLASGRATFDGTSYPADATLRIQLEPAAIPLELTSWPRGVYPVTPSTPHAFLLRLEDAPAGNFDVTDGFIYVAHASNDLIDGSVFIREAFRLNAPVPVPQVFDPPLTVRFRIEN